MENITKYDVTFVHPIAGKLAEKGSISESRALADVRAFLELSVRSNTSDEKATARKKLAKILRETGILASGQPLREYRIEPDADSRFRIVAFPGRYARLTSVLHSVSLRPIYELPKEPEDEVFLFTYRGENPELDYPATEGTLAYARDVARDYDVRLELRDAAGFLRFRVARDGGYSIAR